MSEWMIDMRRPQDARRHRGCKVYLNGEYQRYVIAASPDRIERYKTTATGGLAVDTCGEPMTEVVYGDVSIV